MIPKKIHYCWFGGGVKDDLITKCMETWAQYASDYEIIEWNEEKVDIQSLPQFVQDAYKNKKWAFVSDYIRLYAVYTEGGIYLDTDIELLKPLDDLLDVSCGFSGFQHKYELITAILGAEPKLPIVKELMTYYETTDFINSDGSLNLVANPIVWANILRRHGLNINDTTQKLDQDFIIYDSSYFSGSNKAGYTVHHFQGTWLSDPLYIAIPRKILQTLLGKQRYSQFAATVAHKLKGK